MQNQDTERWRKLCRLAMQEQDPERLLGRCNEIHAELEGHEEEIYEQLRRNEIFGSRFQYRTTRQTKHVQ